VPSRRGVLAGVGLTLLGAGAWLATGPLRLTVLNAALRLDHPGHHAAGALIAALGAALLAVSLRRRAARIGAASVAAAALLLAARLSVYRVELTEQALVSEGLLSRSEIPWGRIGRVEIAPGALLVFESDELVLRVETGSFTADQRATLERGIARRVREAFQDPG